MSTRVLCSLAAKIASAQVAGVAIACDAAFRRDGASLSVVSRFGTKLAPKDRAAFHIGFFP
jgi:hypothetical protein